jgi:hypothetical protein
VPGCRTPHFWRDDGGSIYDAMGPEFTLLRFDSSTDTAPLEAAALRRALPLTVLDVEASVTGELCRHRLVLSRPDQHVAWRGDALPSDSLALIDHIRGATSRNRG